MVPSFFRSIRARLLLIALLLFVYFTWFAPPPEVVKQPLVTDSLTVRPQEKTAEVLSSVKVDTIFSQTANIKEEIITLENDDIRIAFSNKGAVISEAELKNYKTYSRKPLVLVTPSRSRFLPDWGGQWFRYFSFSNRIEKSE